MTAAPPIADQRPARTEAPRAEGAARRTLRVGLFGCALDTGNAGVSALGLSTLRGLSLSGRAFDVTLFDYGGSERPLDASDVAPGLSGRRIGCYNSRRYHRATNLTQMHLAARLGLGGLQPMTRLLSGLDAVLDISGGDSFADLYGAARFRDVTLPKRIALELGVPLILLPQTYGPYRAESARTEAAEILRSARQVWARDEASLKVARGLLGAAFDPERHRAGVDVAFGLPARRPRNERFATEIERLAASGTVLLGLNVSGLLYNQPGEDVRRYGFRGDYHTIVAGILDRLLAAKNAHILLVPHVAPSRPMADCDATAARAIIAALTPVQRERVTAVPAGLGADELKWCVGRCAWFCGTRMHACIAGISQGIPTTAIAYSDKTLGVFETAGVGASVVDPRRHEAHDLVSLVMSGLESRDAARRQLDLALPAVRRRLAEQFDEIAKGVEA